MADEVEKGGVNIPISADTSEFKRATDEAVSHLNRRLDDVQKHAQSSADDLEKSYAQSLKELDLQFEALRSHIKQLSDGLSESMAQLKELSSAAQFKSFDETSVAGFTNLKQTLGSLKIKLSEVRNEMGSFDGTLKEFSNVHGDKAIGDVVIWRQNLTGLQNSLNSTGKALEQLGNDAQSGLDKATEATERLARQNKPLDGLTAKVKSLAAAYLSFRGANSLISGVMSATISQAGAERVLTGRVAATGGAAGFSADELKEQAKALQEVTTYSDQAIMGMQSMMMIFKSVRGDNFTRATQAAMDLSTAIGGSLTTNAMRLGRALEDPVKGMGLLRRAGIVLSASQQQLIKDFMKTGDIAKAQDVILKQVEGTLGGAAKAYRNSLGGALEALRVKWNSLKEMNDRNAFGSMTEAVNELINALSSKQIDEFRKSLGDLVGGTIKSGISAMQALADNVIGVKAAIAALMGMKIASWAVNLIGYIASLGTGFNALSNAIKTATASGLGWLSVAALIAGGASYLNDKRAAKLLDIQNEEKESFKNDAQFQGKEGLLNKDREQLRKHMGELVQAREFLIGRIETLKKQEQSPELNEALQNSQVSVESKEGEKSVVEIAQEANSIPEQLARYTGRLNAVLEELSATDERISELNRGNLVGADPQEYMTRSKTRTGRHGHVKSEIEQMMDKFKVLGSLDTQDAGEIAGQHLPQLEKLRDTLKPMSDDWRKVTATIEQCKEAVKKAKDELFSNMAWDNQHGFLGDLEYYQRLRDEIATLAEGSEEWKKRFSELSSIADRLIDKEYEKIYKEFENGKLTLDEYEQKLKEIAALYGQDLPEVKRKALDDSNKMVEREKKNIYDIKTFTNSWISDLREGIVDAIMDFNSLGDTLQNLGKQLERMVLQLLLFGQDGKGGLLGGAMGGIGNWLLKGLGGIVGSKNGNIFDQRGLVAFANGGIVNKPTLFPFANGTGLMGEAGPEAIMPLHRDGQGRLGVAVAASAQSGGETVTYSPVINVNVENNGSGEMSEDQANAMSAQVREVVDARIADQLYEYKRRGFFRASGAYA